MSFETTVDKEGKIMEFEMDDQKPVLFAAFFDIIILGCYFIFVDWIISSTYISGLWGMYVIASVTLIILACAKIIHYLGIYIYHTFIEPFF